jgi:ATP/maltotriose-dependent transcriptional regulator MalT
LHTERYKTTDAPFVGRVSELEVLRRARQSVTQGNPTVIWIEGAAGTGKTTLARRALADLRGDFVTIVVRGDELASSVPYDIVRRLGIQGSDDGFAVSQELLTHWAQLQEDGPLAVLIEDAHWVDAESLLALLSAARRLEQDRVLVVLTSRFSPTEGWEQFMRDDERCVRLVLASFGAEEVATLSSFHGIELTAQQAARLTDHTGGHALWVHTLLMELTPAELKATGDLPAPRSLASAVTARLSNVSASARDLAAALAVTNQREPLAVIGRVAGIAEPLEALESLLPTGFVRWEPRVPGSPVEFTHPLYRQAIYDDLAPTRRRDLHRSAAQILTPAAVLAHRVAATDGADEDLADELEQAAATERAAGEPALAARNLLWASSVSGDLDRSTSLLVEAGLAYIDAHQVHRAAALREQIEAAPDSAGRNLVLGRIAWDEGDAFRAEKLLTKVVRNDREAPESIVAQGWAKVAELFATQGRAAEAVEAADRALEKTGPDTAVERNGWIMRSLALGELHGAAVALDALSRRLPRDPALVPAREAEMLVARGVLNYYAARATEALDDLRAAVRLGERGTEPYQRSRCHYFLASTMIRRGEWDAAMVQARTALYVTGEDETVWQEPLCHAALGLLLAYRGDWLAAEHHVAQAFDQASAQNNVEGLATAYLAAGALARSRNDPEGVIGHLAVLTSSPPMLAALQFWPWFIEALIDTEQLDRAGVEIERLEAAAAARRLEFGGQLMALRARVSAASGELPEAATMFSNALEHLGPNDPFLDRALVHQSYGRLLQAKGDQSGAIDQLQTARKMLASVGAAPFVAGVDRDLSAAGLIAATASPAKSALGLTDRERDVATLVAQGLSNPEVAAELYVSRKAVEYHLHNIYGKLGIASRRELRDSIGVVRPLEVTTQS